MINPIYKYWSRIESGKILTSVKIKQQLKMLIHVIEEDNDWEYDHDKYLKVIDFIQSFCKHSKGEFAGKPFRLELWQKAIMAATFGIVHKKTGFRKHNELLVVVARKNGKSTWASAVALYMLVGDGENGAEVYATAVKKEQADIVFKESQRMRDKSPVLLSNTYKNKTELEFRSTDSIYKSLASETKSLDGLNGHCYIMDEIHAWTKQDLYDVCRGSLGARRQPLIFKISTAGTTRESVFDSQYEYASAVLNGKIKDPDCLQFIYELDKREEWLLPKMYEKANPNIGVSVSREWLVKYMEKAKASPTEETTFLTKHCNIRENAFNSWLDFETIMKNNMTFDLDDWYDTYAIGGVDLSSTIDLTCATLLRFNFETEYIEVIQMYFIAEEQAAKREHHDKVPYKEWKDQGLVRFTKGHKVDFQDVEAWFDEIRDDYKLMIMSIGYDDWSAEYFVKAMENSGYEMDVVRQGFKTLSPNMKLLEAEFLDHKIAHNNNKILNWNLTNVSIQSDPAGNIKPVKTGGRKSNLRIDGLASLLDAYIAYQRKREDLDFVRELKSMGEVEK